MSRWVGRNAVINIVGVILPSLVGLVALRVLLHALGQAGMGVFSLALGLVGLTGILDFGLSRGMTQYVASAIGAGENRDTMTSTLLKGLLSLAVIGCLIGGLLCVLMPLLSQRLFPHDPVLYEQAISGFRWIALSIPFALVSSGLLSVIEGHQRFSRANAVRVPVGFLVFIIPATVAWCSGNLALALLALALVRPIGFLLCLLAARSLFGTLHMGPWGEPGFRRLVNFSGWLSISNLISPLMVYADRFYLAAMVPASAIAYYTVPLDVTYRATALPLAGLNALFPALTHAHAAGQRASTLAALAMRLLSLLWLPPLLVAALLGRELLTLWLGTAFAEHATPIFVVLLMGVLLNGYAQLMTAILHASGRSDLTARLHMVELPLYVVLVVALVNQFGVLGAALAWSLRVGLDFLLLALAVQRIGGLSWGMVRKLLVLAAVAVTLMLLGSNLGSLPLRATLAAFVALTAALLIWRQLNVKTWWPQARGRDGV